MPQYCAWENVLSGVLSGSNNVPEAEVCALLTAVLVDVGRCWKLIASPLPLRRYNLVLVKAVNGHKTQRTAPPLSPLGGLSASAGNLAEESEISTT